MVVSTAHPGVPAHAAIGGAATGSNDTAAPANAPGDQAQQAAPADPARQPALSDQTRQTTDGARKAAAFGSIATALAMLVGAFIGAVSGALGGRLRDSY